MEALVAQFGYWAVLVGTFLEGETILLAGGYAAHRGWLDLWLVIAAAFVGSAAGDQLYFWIGHRRGRAFLDSRPTWRPRVERARRLLHRHSTLVILGTRYLYGLRIVLPFVLGASGVPIARFVMLNVIGAAIWAVTFAGLGYALGSTLENALHRFERYELDALAAILAIGAVLAVLRWLRRRRVTAAQSDPEPR